MTKYIIKRLIMFVLVLIGVSILSFALIELFGEDPAEILARRANINATQEDILALRESLGLNRPLFIRYFAWIGGLFTGNVGTSISSFNPIMSDIAKYMPISLALVGMALLWVIVIAIPIGLLCARFKNSAMDHTVRGASIIGICFPTFWLGFLLLMQFAVNLHWFSILPETGIKGYILPSFALALPIACSVIRLFRSSLISQMSADYVSYASARGLAKSRILIKHVFRNALPPIVTIFCQYLGYLIAGAAVVESVFSLNGIGTYLIKCVSAADSTAVATCVVIIAAIFVISNLIGDIINRLLCPWMVKEYNA